MATRGKADETSLRRPTNVSLPANLVTDAKLLGINMSSACQAGLVAAVTQERERRWAEDHREAIERNNAWVEKHGLPLARYRMF